MSVIDYSSRSESVIENYVLYFNQNIVVGTQKNRLH